jgi:hypothetical protein
VILLFLDHVNQPTQCQRHLLPEQDAAENPWPAHI